MVKPGYLDGYCGVDEARVRVDLSVVSEKKFEVDQGRRVYVIVEY